MEPSNENISLDNASWSHKSEKDIDPDIITSFVPTFQTITHFLTENENNQLIC